MFVNYDKDRSKEGIDSIIKKIEKDIERINKELTYTGEAIVSARAAKAVAEKDIEHNLGEAASLTTKRQLKQEELDYWKKERSNYL